MARSEVVEKMVVCGRAARWWDNEIKVEARIIKETY